MFETTQDTSQDAKEKTGGVSPETTEKVKSVAAIIVNVLQSRI